MNDIATLFENINREENDVQLQLAESDPIVNEDESWVERLDWKERNEIEIQMADQELDDRMYPIWMDAIDDIRRKFLAIWKICERGVQSDEAEYLLRMIDNIKSDMSVWSNNDPCQWMIEDGEDDGNYICSDIGTQLERRRKYLEEIKGKNNN